MWHAWNKHVVALLVEPGSEINKLLGTVSHTVHQHNDSLCLAAMGKQFRPANRIKRLIRFFLSLHLRKASHGRLVVCGRVTLHSARFVCRLAGKCLQSKPCKGQDSPSAKRCFQCNTTCSPLLHAISSKTSEGWLNL